MGLALQPRYRRVDVLAAAHRGFGGAETIVQCEDKSGRFCKRRARDEAAITRPNGCQNRVQQIELILGRARQNVTLKNNCVWLTSPMVAAPVGRGQGGA